VQYIIYASIQYVYKYMYMYTIYIIYYSVQREASHRVSYAIPLEIIYTTPLQTWNPYNLTFFNGNYYLFYHRV